METVVCQKIFAHRIRNCEPQYSLDSVLQYIAQLLLGAHLISRILGGLWHVPSVPMNKCATIQGSFKMQFYQHILCFYCLGTWVITKSQMFQRVHFHDWHCFNTCKLWICSRNETLQANTFWIYSFLFVCIVLDIKGVFSFMDAIFSPNKHPLSNE